MIRSMAADPIVFALANPVPEITPNLAQEAGALAVATGRSDYPNQVNNSLAFPGVFRGALDVKARGVNDEMKIAAANAIADLVAPEELNAEYLIPDSIDLRVPPASPPPSPAPPLIPAWPKSHSIPARSRLGAGTLSMRERWRFRGGPLFRHDTPNPLSPRGRGRCERFVHISYPRPFRWASAAPHRWVRAISGEGRSAYNAPILWNQSEGLECRSSTGTGGQTPDECRPAV